MSTPENNVSAGSSALGSATTETTILKLSEDMKKSLNRLAARALEEFGSPPPKPNKKCNGISPSPKTKSRKIGKFGLVIKYRKPSKFNRVASRFFYYKASIKIYTMKAMMFGWETAVKEAHPEAVTDSESDAE